MTATVHNPQREDLTRTKTSIGLWFGVLGGPIAALCNVMTDYPAVDRACVNNSTAVLHVLTVVFLVVALSAGWTAWSFRQRAGDVSSTAGGVLPRSQFMGTLGIMTASVAVFGMILQWIPIFFLGACHGT
jgi:heme/copper-type cytochrome/quinol oxidase subunit 2